MVLLLCACGAKSGLDVAPQPAVDAGRRVDAETRRDGGRDAGAQRRDAAPPIDAGPSLPCVVAPPDGTAVLVMGLEAQVTAADVLFLVDQTGSMGPSIDAVESTLTRVLIPGLVRSIPDVQIAIAAYRDFPFSPHGTMTDLPVEVLQTSTADLDLLDDAVQRLFPRGGGDLPESGLFALNHMATGAGYADLIEPADCPAGRFGGACLRRDAVPVICLLLDASLHGGPTVGPSYERLSPRPPGWEETLAALDSAGITVLGLWAGSGPVGGLDGREDLEALARATGALDSRGEPIVLPIGSSAGQVVDAVRTYVEESPIPVVRALVEDVAGDAVDATRFVRTIAAASASPADGAVIVGDHFESVRPGTRVEFRIEVGNDFLPPAVETRTFPVRVVLQDDVNRLRTGLFDIVVPGTRGGACD